MVILTKHIIDRLSERGVTKEEIIITIEKGEEFPAKLGRTGFRSNFYTIPIGTENIMLQNKLKYWQ